MTLYADALAMLKQIQWWGSDSPGGPACPICHSLPSDSHDADCELDALIRRMDSTPMHCRPIGTADRVEQAEKVRGTCPHCGFYNVPDGDSQIGQDVGQIYCTACGHVWERETA